MSNSHDDAVTTGSTADSDQKILNDLNILVEKLDQCQTQLNEQKMGHSNVFRTTSELYEIVGFLEACAPRMVELVEFCTLSSSFSSTGAAPLSDVVLMKALEVNDRLINTLSDLDRVTFQDEENTTGTTEITSPPSNNQDSDNNNNNTAIQQSSSEDEFDAFLSVRTNEAAATTDNDLLS
jgi:hypothetical protein